MAKFSVLLLYPDYIASNYGQETYYAFVEAKDSRDAVKKARIEVMKINEAYDEPEDFYPLLVIAGEHKDLMEGR